MICGMEKQLKFWNLECQEYVCICGVSTEYIKTMKWTRYVARMRENNLFGDLGRKNSVKMSLDQRARIWAGLDCLPMVSSDKHI
jgi:hypothetical protein